MSREQTTAVSALREVLRSRAAQLSLDPATITSPSPNAITAKTPDGSLLRLDVSRYEPMELSL